MAGSISKMGKEWQDTEVWSLLEVWGKPAHQKGFSSYRNRHVYEAISSELKDKYNILKDAESCRVKIKNLKQKYKKIKDNLRRSGAGATTSEDFQFFDALDEILGCRASSQPHVLLDMSSSSTQDEDEESVEDSTECEEEENEVEERTEEKEVVERKEEKKEKPEKKCSTKKTAASRKRKEIEDLMQPFNRSFLELEEKRMKAENERERRQHEDDLKWRREEREMEAQRRREEREHELRMAQLFTNMFSTLTQNGAGSSNSPFQHKSFSQNNGPDYFNL